ncbi:osmotically inducible protein C [Desulfuromonas versatilis]|uniref:Osmotically inducible protein C n=1 Tax=Desulfuromonas versatilis TaxID=2802975 RepID=A0ABN6DUI6_9BACT|nr:bifunctional alpha/beta hydrolase/OsmC family protein [Desulfuromonas versatilis]BCR03174.1 osmotically inducible protein C [Desulfuromonas versatilis]
MKQKRITFPNAEGLELAALLDLPEDEQPIAYALFAHCFTCSKNLSAAANIARALCRRRIAVLRFDFTGLGESEGEFADTNFSSSLRDLVAAARYLEENHEGPSILIGHSLGGAAVLQAAGEIPAVKAVATIAAPGHPRHAARLFEGVREQIEKSGEAKVDLGGGEFTIKKQLLDDLEAQDPTEKIRNLDAALLVLHSPRDKVVGIDNAADIFKAAMHPKSFISLDPADHLLSRREDSLYAGDMIAAWAQRFLESAEQVQALPEVIDNRVTVRTGAEGFYTEMFANGYPLVADEPVSYGGSGQGPSPYDYLLAALGACTSMTVQMYARRKEWPLEDAVVRLRHEKIHAEDCEHCEEKDGKIDRFERELDLKGNLDEEQRQRLLEIAEKCPVHRTLHAEVLIDTKLREKK